jgi:transposase-like protein
MEAISEVQGKRKKTRPPRGAARRSIHSHPHSHPFEVRLKAVRLHLEEGFPPELIARQMGVGKSTLSKWVRLYRDQGEAGLKSKKAGPRRQWPKVAAAVSFMSHRLSTFRLCWNQCQANSGCAGVADFAGLCRNLPS